MRRLLLAFLVLASLGTAAAQDTDALGTLFQTPQERAAIDRARSGEKDSAPTSFGTPRPNPVITGYVKRTDGKDTVFIDNEPFEVKGPKAEALLKPRNVQSYVAPLPLVSSRNPGTSPSSGGQTETDKASTNNTAKQAAKIDVPK